MKEFKTNEELISILENKGVVFNDKELALSNLSKYSYYSIINTYKWIFKIDDHYKDGVTFEEIFAVYKFDKTLKNIFMKYILEIESIVKSKIANVIGQKYGISNYLIKENFNSDIDEKDNTSHVSDLLNTIDDEIEKSFGKHEAITHYKEKYNFVPPWVLTKILSLGTISKFYGLMKQEDKQLISKDFNISDNSMKSALGTLTSIRNICAHDDRLYPYRNTFYVNINKIYHKTIIESKKTNYTTIFIVILLMQKLLDSNMQKNFNSELKLCFRDLEKSISSISINDIKNVMGIPKDYNFE